MGVPKFLVLRSLLLLVMLAFNTAAQPVGKADCNSLSSDARDLCLDQVKARDKLALAQQAYKQTTTAANAYAVTAAKADVAYADYKANVAKCDALALDAKTRCVQVAREKFKKGG